MTSVDPVAMKSLCEEGQIEKVVFLIKHHGHAWRCEYKANSPVTVY